MVNYAKIQTAQDMIDAGIKPKTSRERLRLVLTDVVGELRKQYGVKQELFQALFPSTVIPDETAIRYARALLAGIDVIIFGPPGGGKTKLVNDTIALYPKKAFIVDGCQMQCNPYSLIDPAFAKSAPPCPRCKSVYGADEYRKAGFFDPSKVDPGKVKVRFVHLRDGFGISRFRGSPDTYPEDLAGKMDIRKYEEIGDPFDFRVFSPGKLSHGNNGIVNINEVGKIPQKAQDALLDALSENEVKPSNTREAVPASAIYICDTNTEDLDRISGPLNDRLMAIFLPYPGTVDENYEIVLRNIYRKVQESKEIALEEIMTRLAPNILDIGFPLPLEKALCSLMIAYRANALCHKFEETGSNRALLDADKLARANAMLYGKCAVAQTDIQSALTQALLGNVRPRNTQDYLQLEDNVKKFVEKNLPAKVEEECKTYWCQFAKQFENNAQDFVPIAQELKQLADKVVELSNAASADGKSAQEVRELRKKQHELVRAIVDRKKAKPFMDYVEQTTAAIPIANDNKDSLMINLLFYLAAHIEVPRTGY